MEQFRKYLGTLISTSLPHEECAISKEEILALVKSRKALLVRYTSDSQIFSEQNERPTTGWWHCVRTESIDIATLTAKQRYRVRRGLQRNDIFLADADFIDANADALYNAYVKSIEDYPEVYRSKPTPKETFISSPKQYIVPGRSDLWICRDKESGNIAGYGHTPYIGKVAFLSMVKLDPAYFKNEVNAALIYEICRHYLNELSFDYICDGERNIRHQTSYQDFLVTVLGFKKAPCKLNIVYHPLFKPVIKALYPFRKMLKPFCSNKLIYNAYCLLFQEQCARECNQ